MFSTEIPSGPSSPWKPSSPLRADETLELQSSDFSIRDYVFKFRRENIATSWPFPQQLLNLCLKHGISDPLPPFEPPDRVRDQCGLEAEEVDHTTSCLRAEEVSPQIDPTDAGTCDIKSKTCLQSAELVVDCSDQAQYPSSEALKQKSYLIDVSDDETSCEGNVETVPAVKNQDKIERVDEFGEQVHRPGRVIRSDKGKQLAIEVAEAHPPPSKLNILHYSPAKKFKSIVRLNSTAEIDRSEDRLYSSSTVSDPMASKVCPVCKIFSSTSNTTLNAHIDQCLSADCKRVEKVVTKNLEPKVKPSKKRLMVDVYATSLPYTLEDLDNRNGTNWASELALMIRTSEANSAVKRLKLSPEDNRDEEEQAEVSPSDDTKNKEKQAEVSPSDDTKDKEKQAEVSPSDDNRDREKPAEVRLDGNEGAVYVDSNGIKLRILSKFNDTLPVIPMKNFKLKKHAKKMDDKNPLIAKKKCFGSKYLKVKQKTIKLSSSESFKGEIQVAREEGYDANTHLEKEESPSEIPNNSDKSRDSGSATLRNWICSKRSDLPKKLNHKDGKGKFMNINQPDISNSLVAKSHITKLSSPSEGLTISPKIKRVDLLPNNVETDKSGKSSKPPTFNPKWSSKSNSKNGLVLRKCRSMGTPSPIPSRREKIHTSTPKSGDSFSMTMHSPWSSHLQLKMKRSLSLKTKALFGGQSSVERSNSDITNTLSISKTIRKPRSFLGTKAAQRRRPGLDAVRTMRTPQSDRSMNFTRPTEEVLCPESPSSTTISESEDEEYKCPVENQKYKLSKLHNPVTACRDSISDPSDIQVELLSSSMRKGVANPAVSEALAPTSSTKSDQLPSLDGNVHSSCDSDAHAEPSFVNMCNEQAVQCYKDSRSNGLSNNEGLRGAGYTSAAQYGTCQAQNASIQETSACLTSYAIHDIPREVSSITSFRRTSGHHRNLAIDSEQSGSPLSNASTISRSSHKDSEFRNHGADTLLRPIVQDKLPSAIPSDERRNREVKAFHLVKEYEKSSDQPCCCSRNGGLPGQSQLLRQHGHAERVLPSEGKWVSHLYVTANASSSLNSCTNQRTDFGVTPVLESPTESVTTRASADSVAKVLTCTDFSSPSPSPRTPTQSTSNSILRLMGKNLMVVNKEESTAEPSMVYHAPEIPSSAQCLRPPAFPTNNGSAIFSHVLHSPNTQVGGYPGSWLSGVKMKLDQQIHHNMGERTSVSYLPPREAISSAQANTTKDTIEIDDSSEFNIRVRPVLHPTNLMHQRPFTCFPSDGQFISRDADNVLSLYPNVCPRGYANNMVQGNGSEVLPPRPPVPLAFQTPPGQFVPRFYYSQMLR